MIKLCAHCVAAGWLDRAFLGEVAPLENPAVTHGVCAFHLGEWQREIEQLRLRREAARA